jgi:hypothetical protein
MTACLLTTTHNPGLSGELVLLASMPEDMSCVDFKFICFLAEVNSKVVLDAGRPLC